MELYKCLGCGVDCVKGRTKINKFCSNKCQGGYKWVTETAPRIERGGCSEAVTLKKFLIERHGEICKKCGLPPEWMGEPLTLQVDHIDGNSDNNNPENLRLLCPNCHTQTPTHGSKGMGNRYRKSCKRNVSLRAYKNLVP